MRRYVQGLVVLGVIAAAIGMSCRRNQPSLVDRNQPPETQLWYAPPDSSDYEYLVHMYWRGVDGDGTTPRFIWTVQDSLVEGEATWNPAASIADYRQGRITSRTDSVLAFTAYKNVAGVGVRKNRQAFYVAAIDDNGVIDPTPAVVEFVATIGRLPEMRFVVYPDEITPSPYRNRTPPADTVGMFKPFAISYHGLTTNGQVRGYEFFALSSTITLPGQNVWTEDLSDTLRTFSNVGVEALPAGVLRFAARCIDDANAESQIDAGQFTRGVAQVVVNFDPDTWITDVKNTYIKSSTAITEDIDFTDGVPDTVPFNSWTYFQYSARDDVRDTWTCSLTNPDKCIDFQVKYQVVTTSGNNEDSGWLPRNGTHDSDANAATDSNSVNAGSLDYTWFVRGVDENGTVDGTPPSFKVVGNFRPILHTSNMADHFGNPLNQAIVDTLTWNFYKPIGWPAADSLADASTGFTYEKRWAWTLNASGRDHDKDPDGSSIQSWRYYVFSNYTPGAGENPGSGTSWNLGRSGDSWFPSSSLNIMSDRFELVVRYNDPEGDDLMTRLPAYFNQLLTIVLYGRDTITTGGGEFIQSVYWDPVPTADCDEQECCGRFKACAGTGVSTRNTINTFAISPNGRATPKKTWSFFFKFVR